MCGALVCDAEITSSWWYCKDHFPFISRYQSSFGEQQAITFHLCWPTTWCWCFCNWVQTHILPVLVTLGWINKQKAFIQLDFSVVFKLWAVDNGYASSRFSNTHRNDHVFKKKLISLVSTEQPVVHPQELHGQWPSPKYSRQSTNWKYNALSFYCCVLLPPEGDTTQCLVVVTFEIELSFRFWFHLLGLLMACF